MARDKERAELSAARATVALVVGLAAGFAFVLFPYGIGWVIASARGEMPSSFTAVSGFTNGLTLLFPMVQGFALALALGRGNYPFMRVEMLLLALTAIELVGAFFFLREGIICLIILTPLIVGMMSLGAVLGRFLARRARSLTAQVSLVPLVVLAVFAEAAGPKPNYPGVVVDSVTIDAPAPYVWRYVVDYPENTSPPEYWLWRIGLPHPVQSTATTQSVGATRVCRFSGGIAFEERITELTPNEVMTFDVTEQPNHPEVIGHFQFDRGQIRLAQNADGTTTVTATSWYRLFVRPAAYFDLWTADITRHVHFRVLNHIKELAERDYEAASNPSET